MTVNQFIQYYSLKAIDAIVMKKKYFGMLDHYVTFLGYHPHSNEPVFVANYTKGTRVLTKEEINKFTEVLEPFKIDYFDGNKYQREEGVERALQLVGRKDYDLISNNCEDYKTYIRTGKFGSMQVQDAANGLMLLGTGLTIAGGVSKSKNLLGAGLLTVGVGLLLDWLEKQKNE